MSPPLEENLAALIPHQGGMCLLERVLAWDDTSIRLATDTHRALDNPLRSAHGNETWLRAVHLCEYGAQAMAVHGALRARARGTQMQPGFLVSLRAVHFACERVDDLPDELIVIANCLQDAATSLQYSFSISHRDRELAAGRAAVVLAAQMMSV
jgi:predicted hotdog family 3-hydroxylacyl-ACP dehydratase